MARKEIGVNIIIGNTTYHRVASDGIAHPTKDMDRDAPFHARCSPREIAIFLARNWGPSENAVAIGAKVPAGIRRTIDATPMRDLNTLVGQDIRPTPAGE